MGRIGGACFDLGQGGAVHNIEHRARPVGTVRALPNQRFGKRTSKKAIAITPQTQNNHQLSNKNGKQTKMSTKPK